MVVRVSIKFFMNFGIVKMLQINTFWKLLKFTLIKSYEQMLVKIIYLTSPIFVKHLKVKWGLYEFLWNL